MKENTAPPLANTVNDACRRLSISRTTIYQLIADGHIRTFKLGARTLIPEDELRKFVDRMVQLT